MGNVYTSILSVLVKRRIGGLVVLVAVTSMVLGTSPAGAQTGASGPSGADADDSRHEGPTAEDVLRALQRERPSQEVLYPVGSMPPDPSTPTVELLPEGMTVVDAAGVIERSGHDWLFVFESPSELRSVNLLRNAVLEVMIRTVLGAREPVVFVVSGELTVYEGQNYLLPRVAHRATRTQHGGESLSYRQGADAGGESVAPVSDKGKEGSGSRTASAPESVEDVLAALQAAQPDRQAMAPLEIKPDGAATISSVDGTMTVQQDQGSVSPLMSGGTLSGSSGTQAERGELRKTLRPDGTVYSRRAGRVVLRGDRWYFVPQADHPDNPELPLALLRCRATELMARTWRDDPHGLMFTVSGELTLFEEENYLLPRLAMRRIVSDNLRK